jgi:heme A synthase
VVVAVVLPGMFLLRSGRDQVYSILWALVFGFATLNILSLGARRLEHTRGLNFGEILAIMVVLVSVVLLSWELLYMFHILPIHLAPR